MVRRRELKKRELIRVLRAEFTLSVQSFGAALGIEPHDLCGHGSSWARETESSLDADGRLRWQVRHFFFAVHWKNRDIVTLRPLMGLLEGCPKNPLLFENVL